MASIVSYTSCCKATVSNFFVRGTLEKKLLSVTESVDDNHFQPTWGQFFILLISTGLIIPTTSLIPPRYKWPLLFYFPVVIVVVAVIVLAVVVVVGVSRR